VDRFEYLGPWAERAQVPLSTALVWHVALKHQLRVVVLVIRKDPHKPRFMVLASTDLALDGRKGGEFYGARFQSELLFRHRPQFPGLRDGQARAEAARDFQCPAARATRTRARAEELRGSPDPAAQVFSRASWQHRHFQERVREVGMEPVALAPTWVKNQPGSDELKTYGAIAA
jgi:hypothetical protein